MNSMVCIAQLILSCALVLAGTSTEAADRDMPFIDEISENPGIGLDGANTCATASGNERELKCVDKNDEPKNRSCFCGPRTIFGRVFKRHKKTDVNSDKKADVNELPTPTHHLGEHTNELSEQSSEISERPNDLESILTTVQFFLILNRGLADFSRFVAKMTDEYISPASIELFKEVLAKEELISKFPIRTVIEEVINNPTNIPKRIFMGRVIFCIILLEEFKTAINLMKPEFLLQVKIGLLKSFVQIIFYTKDMLRDANFLRMKSVICQIFLTIIHQFSVTEIYKLNVDELHLLQDYFEYFLRSALEIKPILTCGEVVGCMYGDEKVRRVEEAMRGYEGFLIRHCVKDEEVKVWIHFGSKSVERMNGDLTKAFLPIFWRALRNYVVLLGGNGILVTFGDETPEKLICDVTHSGEFSVEVRHSGEFSVKKCGYWNLNDPKLEGQLVFSKAEEMKIVFKENVNSMDETKILGIHMLLEIDGKTHENVLDSFK